MRLTFQFSEDWLIFARTDDGSWWTANCETWPEWLDAAERQGINPSDHEAVDALACADGAIEEHIVPRITAWDTQLSPTASAVSQPTAAGLQGAVAAHGSGFVGFAAWEPVPRAHWAELDQLAARKTTT